MIPVTAPSSSTFYGCFQGEVTLFIPKTLIWKAILDGECDWWGCEQEMAPRENQFVHYKYPADGCSPIHVIWTDSPAWITSWNDGNTYVKALRHPSVEFIFAQHPWIENDCLFADVILPVNTKLEEDDINTDLFGGQMNLHLPRAPLHRAAGRIVQRLRDRLHDRRPAGPAGGVHRRHVDPRAHQDGIREVQRRPPRQLGAAPGEGLLRHPHQSRLGEGARGHDRVLRGSRGQPAHHAHRQAGVLLRGTRRALPRRRGAPPGAALDIQEREPPGVARLRPGAEVSAHRHQQPSALGHPRPARRHHLAARDRHLQDPRHRRLPVPPAVDAPGGRRSAGHQAQGHRLHLQRARQGARRAPTSPSGSCPAR